MRYKRHKKTPADAGTSTRAAIVASHHEDIDIIANPSANCKREKELIYNRLHSVGLRA